MTFSRLLIALALLGFCQGCGGPTNKPPDQNTMDQAVLNDVGELYRSHQVAKHKPPTTIKDFQGLEQGAPLGMNALQQGDVIVQFGATLPSTEEGVAATGGDEVLAYQKQVPQSGGQVLMLNRTIQTMTADQFKTAKKAGTTKP